MNASKNENTIVKIIKKLFEWTIKLNTEIEKIKNIVLVLIAILLMVIADNTNNFYISNYELDVNVTNTPDVNVINTPDVNVTNVYEFPSHN